MSIRFSDWVLEHSIETEYTPYDLVEEQLVAQMDVCTSIMECYAKQFNMAMIYQEADQTETDTDTSDDKKSKDGDGKKWYQKLAEGAKKAAAAVGKFFKALWLWMQQTVTKAVAFGTSKRIKMIIKRIDKLSQEDKAKITFKIPDYIARGGQYTGTTQLGNTSDEEGDEVPRYENVTFVVSKDILGGISQDYIDAANDMANKIKSDSEYSVDGLADKFRKISEKTEKMAKLDYKAGRKGAYEKDHWYSGAHLKEGTGTTDKNADEFKKLLEGFAKMINSKEIKDAMKLFKRKDLMNKIVSALGENAKKEEVKEAKAGVKECYDEFMKAGNMIRFAMNKYVVKTVSELSRCIKEAFGALKKKAEAEGDKAVADEIAQEETASQQEEQQEEQVIHIKLTGTNDIDSQLDSDDIPDEFDDPRDLERDKELREANKKRKARESREAYDKTDLGKAEKALREAEARPAGKTRDRKVAAAKKKVDRLQAEVRKRMDEAEWEDLEDNFLNAHESYRIPFPKKSIVVSESAYLDQVLDYVDQVYEAVFG